LDSVHSNDVVVVVVVVVVVFVYPDNVRQPRYTRVPDIRRLELLIEHVCVSFAIR